MNYEITIPPTANELANLLYEYAHDWEAALQFIATVAKTQGKIVNVNVVSKLVAKKFKEN